MLLSPSIFYWIFSYLNRGRTLPRFPNAFSKHNMLFIQSLRKNIYGIASIFPNQSISIQMAPIRNKSPGKTHQHITTTSPVFIVSGTFHHYERHRGNLRSQRQGGYRGHGHLWLRPKHVTNPGSPQITSSYIHYTNHSTRSPFLYTTQLQTKTTPKQRI